MGSELLGTGAEDRKSPLALGSNLVSTVARSQKEGERWSGVAIQKWLRNLVWLCAAVSPALEAKAGT